MDLFLQDVPHYASTSKKKQRKFSVKDYKLGETGPLRYAQESKYSKKAKKWIDDDDEEEDYEDQYLIKKSAKKVYKKNFKKYLHQGYHKYD